MVDSLIRSDTGHTIPMPFPFPSVHISITCLSNTYHPFVHRQETPHHYPERVARDIHLKNPATLCTGPLCTSFIPSLLSIPFFFFFFVTSPESSAGCVSALCGRLDTSLKSNSPELDSYMVVMDVLQLRVRPWHGIRGSRLAERFLRRKEGLREFAAVGGDGQ